MIKKSWLPITIFLVLFLSLSVFATQEGSISQPVNDSTINTSNYPVTIIWTYSDTNESGNQQADITYNPVGATAIPIVTDLNLSTGNNCNQDTNFVTTRTCQYVWNTPPLRLSNGLKDVNVNMTRLDFNVANPGDIDLNLNTNFTVNNNIITGINQTITALVIIILIMAFAIYMFTAIAGGANVTDLLGKAVFGIGLIISIAIILIMLGL